jgi:hypothetical protein
MDFPNIIELPPFSGQYIIILIFLSTQMYIIVRIKYEKKELREAYKWSINAIDVYSIPISVGLSYI